MIDVVVVLVDGGVVVGCDVGDVVGIDGQSVPASSDGGILGCRPGCRQ